MNGLIEKFQNTDVNEKGYAQLNEHRQTLLNLYAFLYFKFDNASIRKNILEKASNILYESVRAIPLTGKFKNTGYYAWDYERTISVIEDSFLKSFETYNPYPRDDGKFYKFVPYFLNCSFRKVQNEYNQDMKNRKAEILTDFTDGNSGDAQTLFGVADTVDIQQDYETEQLEDIYAKKLVNCLVNLLNVVHFQKFYSLGEKEVPQKRYDYFKLFLTGDIIALVKNTDEESFNQYVLPVQNNLLDTMNNRFVDFVYTGDLKQYIFLCLRNTNFKTYRDLSIEISSDSKKSSAENELDLPFHQNVYAKFTGKSASNIHNMFIEEKGRNGKTVKGYKYFFRQFTKTQSEEEDYE